MPGDPVEIAESKESRSAIQSRLARYAELYAEGGENGIGRERYDAEKARARRDLAALDARATVVAIPQAIDWTWPPEELNRLLRAMWSEVRLDADMRPVEALWTMPGWRAD